MDAFIDVLSKISRNNKHLDKDYKFNEMTGEYTLRKFSNKMFYDFTL